MPFFDPDAVARLLRPRTVVATDPLGGSWAPVARAVLDDGSTVVVKERRRSGAGWGFDVANLRNERAALELLGGLGVDLSPRFLSGDDDAGVVVMTDLRGGTTVEQLLLDPIAGAGAAAALVAHGRALGRLHAATATPIARETFVRRRTALGPHDAAADRSRYVTHQLPDLWQEVGVRARDLGFTAPGAVGDDLEDLWRELGEPGPFLALTHLDASPQNSLLLADGSARLVDFEGAGIRHIGLDASFLRFPFPTYGHWSVLPGDVRAAMEQAYRGALVDGGLVAANDDIAYDRAMAVGCAALVVLRIHRLPSIALDDEQALRRRTQMVSAIEVFLAAADRANRFPGLASWFAGLADEMRARWREAGASPREFPALPLKEPATP